MEVDKNGFFYLAPICLQVRPLPTMTCSMHLFGVCYSVVGDKAGH